MEVCVWPRMEILLKRDASSKAMLKMEELHTLCEIDADSKNNSKNNQDRMSMGFGLGGGNIGRFNKSDKKDGKSNKKNEKPASHLVIQTDCKDVTDMHFPLLEMFWWRRVIADEFHEFLSQYRPAQASLLNIFAAKRWGFTGTPPTNTIFDVMKVGAFFHVDLAPKKNACCDFLDHFARQNTAEIINEIPLCEHLCFVNQNAL